MNQTQRKYLRERMSKLIQKRRESLSVKHGLESTSYVNDYSFKSLVRYKHVKNGKAHFLLPKNLQEKDVDQLKDYYNFDENIIKVETEEMWNKYCTDRDSLQQEAQKIEDEIMLGDNQEALKLLEEFENG
jgi:hypothetical protein